MKLLLIVLAMSATSSVFAQYGSGRGFCGELFSSYQYECRNIMRNSYIDREALRVCRDEVFMDSDQMDCLRAIRNKSYTYNEVYSCEREFHDRDVVRCFRRSGRPTNGGGNGGGYPNPGPIPGSSTVFELRPNFQCIRNIGPVSHPDRIYSDGILGGPRGELRNCERRRNGIGQITWYNGTCEVTGHRNLPRTDRCYQNIINKIQSGTITRTHRRGFRDACSMKIYRCSRN